MAKAVLLWPAGSDVRLGEAEARGLARLGITAVALVRGDGIVGAVVEGWAFDPARHVEAAITALSGQRPSGRLLPVAEIGVSGAAMNGGSDGPRTPARRRAGGGDAAGHAALEARGAQRGDRHPPTGDPEGSVTRGPRRNLDTDRSRT